MPEATRRAYESDLRHFCAWGGSIPATDLMVAEYLAVYAGELACSTLKRRLAAIAKAHRVYGPNSPTRSELVKATLRGIRRRHGGPLTRARESAAASCFLAGRRRSDCITEEARRKNLMSQTHARDFRVRRIHVDMMSAGTGLAWPASA